jgi:hypothetical protein
VVATPDLLAAWFRNMPDPPKDAHPASLGEASGRPLASWRSASAYRPGIPMTGS